ncbi:hypothetical protein K3495_g6789 [Podosphaera aphanis]|nr:hypothetical protein K3495_g6789 [Podosphaera aphanis]
MQQPLAKGLELPIQHLFPPAPPVTCQNPILESSYASQPANHPLRSEDALLVRTKLRQLLNKPELIKDIRTVPTGIALVAPTPT